ncbi:DUF2645 family protein [Zobellia amurskyensis]|uniref:DUF2645 family protein n=1 Tax=Zobellia amurskyensis TaxID=248905 RepID=A0A7X2ZQD8_9FLAO|nr:DUF2645 family protein [Zobellia amurskyensis]
MKNSIFTYFSVFILFSLILIKVTSFHVYTHQDDSADTIEKCSICDVAIQNQNSEFTFACILVLILLPLIIYTGKKVSSLVLETSSFYLPYVHFGRPPPCQG